VQFCIDLLEEKGIALVPGSGFGRQGAIRISFAATLGVLEVAMQGLREFCANRA